MTSSRAGRSRRLAVARAVLLGWLALLAPLGLVLAPPLAAQAAPVERAGPGGEDDVEAPAAPRLRLVRQSPWVEPDGRFELVVAVEGAPADAQLAVEIGLALDSRSRFERSIEGDWRGTLFATSRPLAELPAEAGGVRVDVPLSSTRRRDAATASLVREGVYPVRVEVRSADDEGLVSFTTHLVRLLPERDYLPLQVAVALPLVTPPSVQPDGEVRIDPAARDGLRTVARSLTARPRVPLTVAPTPELLEALSGASPADAAVVSQLATALQGRQLLVAPYVPVELDAMVEAGLDDELGSQLRRGADVLQDALGSTPTVGTWLADGPLGPAALRALRDRQVVHVVLPSDALSPVALPTTLLRPFEVSAGGERLRRAAEADGALSAAFARGGDPVLAASHLLADLAQLFFDSPGDPAARGAIALAPADWTPSGPFLDTLLAGLEGHPLLTPVTLSRWFATVEPAEDLAREVVPAEVPDLQGYAPALQLTRLRANAFGSMVGPASPFPDAFDRRLLAASARGLDSRERREYLTAVTAVVDGELRELPAPERLSVTLTAREGRVPLVLRNEATYPVRVLLRLSSDKLDFPGGADQVVVLPPDSTQRLEVEVRARASGQFPLSVQLLSPDGFLSVHPPVRSTVRSLAVSGVGIVVSAGAGLFLAAWWGRHVRRVRRARTSPPAPAPAL